MSNIDIVGLKDAQEKFERNFGDAIAILVPGGPSELWSRLAAEFSLFPELSQEVDECLQKWQVAPSEHKLIARGPLVAARYKLLCQMFLRLMERGAFEQTVDGTSEAVEQIELMEQVVGLRQAPPPPPPPKLQQEILDGEVIADWATLSTEKFKKKTNNSVAYRETFERLSAENKLSSQVTTLHDGYADGRVGG